MILDYSDYKDLNHEQKHQYDHNQFQCEDDLTNIHNLDNQNQYDLFSYKFLLYIFQYLCQYFCCN